MNGRVRLKAERQADKDTSSWSLKEAIIVRLWEFLWAVFLRWTPKKLNFVRVWALRLFGAKIPGHAFVFSSARIYAPFNLTLLEGSCIGPLTNIYNLAQFTLGERAVVSQEAMICGGTHDLTTRRMPLMVGDIDIGADAFIGARAIVLPGVKIGDGGVVGAGAVVTKDVQPWTVIGGNPAKTLRERVQTT